MTTDSNKIPYLTASQGPPRQGSDESRQRKCMKNLEQKEKEELRRTDPNKNS